MVMNADQRIIEEAEQAAIAAQPLTVIVTAWDEHQVRPGSSHYLGVTITNRGHADALVRVRLEPGVGSEPLAEWCNPAEQWLALSHGKSGELTFHIQIPADALPRWWDYDIVTLPQGAYADSYLPRTHRRLQVLAPDTSDLTPDPTFTLNPTTTPDRPLIVRPGEPITVDLLVQNRSERVDRFRLDCTGLPDDWDIRIDYPTELGGVGLLRVDDSLGLNPGDPGGIRVIIQPSPIPLAGTYIPTFRLRSENDPHLGLLDLLYLRVDPIYDAQAQLQVVQEQVTDIPALFMLHVANLGNTPRYIQRLVRPLTPEGHCTYTWQVDGDMVTIPPQSTRQIVLEGKPRRWWTRPWFGVGKPFPFRVELRDPVDGQAIAPDTLQGYLTWMPRPWWQLLLVALTGLGIVGTLAFLIWWYWLRPPVPPEVVEFAAEDSRYFESNGDMARVRWSIEHPEQIKTLKLTGYSPEGEVLSGPLVYTFDGKDIPAGLNPFCVLKSKLLVCNQVRSDAFQPGKYVFELLVTPKGRRSKPIALKSAPVEIAAKPYPTVTALVPRSLVYREAGAGVPTPAEKALPEADALGIRLDWIVTHPQDITGLYLVGRDKDNKMVGDLLYRFPTPGQLPNALRPFCRIGAALICQNVPTGLKAPGEYRLELQPIWAKKSEAEGAEAQPTPTEVKPKSTEVVKIQPRTPQIVSLRINGQEAPAKLVIPVQQGMPVPSIQVSWQVRGGSKTQVQLTPAPGTVPLVGQISFPLSPQGSSTIALQVTTPTGEVITRSVLLESLPQEPPALISVSRPAQLPKLAPPISTDASGLMPAPTASPAAPPPVGAPQPASRDRLSPSEQPPQFGQ